MLFARSRRLRRPSTSRRCSRWVLAPAAGKCRLRVAGSHRAGGAIYICAARSESVRDTNVFELPEVKRLCDPPPSSDRVRVSFRRVTCPEILPPCYSTERGGCAYYCVCTIRVELHPKILRAGPCLNLSTVSNVPAPCWSSGSGLNSISLCRCVSVVILAAGTIEGFRHRRY